MKTQGAFMKEPNSTTTKNGDCCVHLKCVKDQHGVHQKCIRALVENIYKSSQPILGAFSAFDPMLIPNRQNPAFHTYGAVKVKVPADHLWPLMQKHLSITILMPDPKVALISWSWSTTGYGVRSRMAYLHLSFSYHHWWPCPQIEAHDSCGWQSCGCVESCKE